MTNSSGTFRLAPLILWIFVVSPCGASPGLSVYDNAPTPIRHAAHRLSDYTGIPLDQASAEKPAIRIELNSTANPAIGTQGYTIRTTNGGVITIHGNTAEGATNGVYTFLRTLMIERRKDPFSRRWDMQEKPQFPIREMILSPYRFGASYGFAALSLDRWSIEEWKEYVDFMRLGNMTTVVMGSHRVYHPDYPHSEREKWRYEVWKQVMDYCHQVGMKFHWYMNPNLVTQQAYWDNPSLRADQEAAYWTGNALIWSKGKDLILKTQGYMLEYFRGLDGLELIYTDGGGFSMDDATGSDPTGYFADATRSYMDLLRKTGNAATFTYWNWVPDIWSRVFLPEQVLQKFPKLRTLQDDIVTVLPKNVGWLDTSILTIAHSWRSAIEARGNPPCAKGFWSGRRLGSGRLSTSSGI